jgi:hypothetical protein
MSSEAPKPTHVNRLPLEAALTAEEEHARVFLAVLSSFAIIALVTSLVLPGIWDDSFPPPWNWPPWGRIVGLMGVCLWGWICTILVITVGKRRFKHWRAALGPYEVWLLQGSPPDQALKFTIRQNTRRPVTIERVDVSLVYQETIVQFHVDPAAGPSSHTTLKRDRELWSHTKKSAFKSAFFPANRTIEIAIDFPIPDVAGLHRRLDADDHQRPERGNTDVEETRHFGWRARIQTRLTNGRATEDFFCLPVLPGDLARSDSEIKP